jgi:hypothetical protein
MSEYGSNPILTLENTFVENYVQNYKSNIENLEKSYIYLGRVTITGEAATAAMIQLLSGLTSNTISLFISTV